MLRKVKGISLIELVLSMTIVSIALTSVVLAFFQSSVMAPPAINQQALNIASGYLTEILSKNFPTSLPCPAPPASRANYTNICDYNNLVNAGAMDNQGNLITGLGSFNVSVSLDTTAVNLGGLTPGTQVVRIDVLVTNQAQLMPKLIISAYKGNH